MASDESEIVWFGERPAAEALILMLTARGINASLVGEHPLEGGELVSAILVAAADLEDAKALIADFESGAAARKG